MAGRRVFYVAAAAGLAADLASKAAIYRLTAGQAAPEIFRDSPLLGITWVWNAGGVFGLGQGAGPFFALASLAAIGVIFWMLYSSDAGRWGLQLALGLVLAGALGNLYDRLLYAGKVRDFINLHFIKWPAFNLADVFISVGCVALVLLLLQRKPEAGA
jgi:signal peptidase II